MNTLPRIKSVSPMDDYLLSVLFDDGRKVVYSVVEDIETINAFSDLRLSRDCGRRCRLIKAARRSIGMIG